MPVFLSTSSYGEFLNRDSAVLSEVMKDLPLLLDHGFDWSWTEARIQDLLLCLSNDWEYLQPVLNCVLEHHSPQAGRQSTVEFWKRHLGSRQSGTQGQKIAPILLLLGHILGACVQCARTQHWTELSESDQHWTEPSESEETTVFECFSAMWAAVSLLHALSVAGREELECTIQAIGNWDPVTVGTAIGVNAHEACLLNAVDAVEAFDAEFPEEYIATIYSSDNRARFFLVNCARPWRRLCDRLTERLPDTKGMRLTWIRLKTEAAALDLASEANGSPRKLRPPPSCNTAGSLTKQDGVPEETKEPAKQAGEEQIAGPLPQGALLKGIGELHGDLNQGAVRLSQVLAGDNTPVAIHFASPLSASDLARNLRERGLSRATDDAVDSILRRYRKKHDECFVEIPDDDRRRNTPNYLYRPEVWSWLLQHFESRPR